MRNAPILLLLLLLAACATRPPVGSLVRLPRDTAQECTNVCESIGLRLTAVVVVASSAGCVCEAQPGPGATPGGASAASAGAIIVVEEEEAAQHAQQQQHPFPTHH